MEDIQHFIHLYIKKWYWFAISVFICLAIAILYYINTPAKYKVDTTLMLRTFDKNEKSQKDFDLMGYERRKNPREEQDMLRSRDIMQQVVTRLNIQTIYEKRTSTYWTEQYPHHDLNIQTDNKDIYARVTVNVKDSGYKVIVKYGLFKSETFYLSKLDTPINTKEGVITLSANQPLVEGDTYRITIMSVPSAVAYYIGGLNLELARESNAITISTLTSCPTKAIDMLNNLVEIYNYKSAEDQKILAVSTSLFIEKRLQQIAFELDSVEQSIEQYKSLHLISDLSNSGRYFMESSYHYADSLKITELQLQMINYLYNYITDKANYSKTIPANLGMNEGAVNMLISRYNSRMFNRIELEATMGENNPMIAQIDNELFELRSQIVATLNSFKESVTIRSRSLQQREAIYSSKLSSLPEQERKYIEILRSRATKEKLYLFLNEKREESSIVASSTTAPALVVNSAQKDPIPTTPKLKMTVMIAIFLGMMIPACLIYLLELKKIIMPAETEQERQIRTWGLHFS